MNRIESQIVSKYSCRCMSSYPLKGNNYFKMKMDLGQPPYLYSAASHTFVQYACKTVILRNSETGSIISHNKVGLCAKNKLILRVKKKSMVVVWNVINDFTTLTFWGFKLWNKSYCVQSSDVFEFKWLYAVQVLFTFYDSLYSFSSCCVKVSKFPCCNINSCVIYYILLTVLDRLHEFMIVCLYLC